MIFLQITAEIVGDLAAAWLIDVYQEAKAEQEKEKKPVAQIVPQTASQETIPNHIRHL
jgi:hypothetical protein